MNSYPRKPNPSANVPEPEPKRMRVLGPTYGVWKADANSTLEAQRRARCQDEPSWPMHHCRAPGSVGGSVAQVRPRARLAASVENALPTNLTAAYPHRRTRPET